MQSLQELKSIIRLSRKTEKKHDHAVLLAKTKWNSIEVLIFKASYINHGKFVSVNNVLRVYNDMKKEIKNPEDAVEYIIWRQCEPIVSVVKKY